MKLYSTKLGGPAAETESKKVHHVVSIAVTGDMNCDGHGDAFDIEPFLMCLFP